jgi:hypothetical protein
LIHWCLNCLPWPVFSNSENKLLRTQTVAITL